MSATPIAAPRLEVRNRRFAFDRVPKTWHGKGKAVTAFFNNLSVFFPHGEQFFIDAVKAHRDVVQARGGERLLREVALFCAQEGMHAREHNRYNEWLEAQGFPAKRYDEKVKRLLDHIRDNAPKSQRLAVTAALEHFTALMGRCLLDDPRLLEDADPEMRDLWSWHAMEEAEHRAVAYDVYKLIGAPYAERTLVMLAVAAGFWGLILQHQVEFMRVYGIEKSPREWASLFKYLFIQPGGLFGMWVHWLDYFRPDFHPGYDHP